MIDGERMNNEDIGMVRSRKDLMRGLEACVKADCDHCPYDDIGCSPVLAYDALVILTEPVKPKVFTPESKTVWSNWYVCGVCEHPVDPGDKFCRECGRPIKWEEQDD